jgi:hypothetical protein
VPKWWEKGELLFCIVNLKLTLFVVVSEIGWGRAREGLLPGMELLISATIACKMASVWHAIVSSFTFRADAHLALARVLRIGKDGWLAGRF